MMRFVFTYEDIGRWLQNWLELDIRVKGFATSEGTYGGVAYDTGEEMVPSIRLENLYKGMTDVRYLRLLEDVAKARCGEALADEALKFTRQSLRELPTRYQHDSARADAFRDKCIEYLKALTIPRK